MLHLRCLTGFRIHLCNCSLYQCPGIAISSVSPGSCISRNVIKNLKVQILFMFCSWEKIKEKKIALYLKVAKLFNPFGFNVLEY